MGTEGGRQPGGEHLVFGPRPGWKVVVGHHAREQMGVRGVTAAVLRETLRSPDMCYPSSKQRRTNIVRSIGPRKVRVVAREYAENSTLFVVTVIVHDIGENQP